MKRILFSLIIFFILSTNSYSNHLETALSLKPFCDNNISQKNLKEMDNLRIEKIEVDIMKYRRWTTNGIRIITHNARFIPDKYKERFKAKILVTYENNVQCVYNGRVRQSGDEKDHIRLLGNSIIQSLDIHLRNGHIRGITKFKLFLPNTRGVSEDEILQTEILRHLNYLAPRTINVNARINQTETKMLFQEKISKELLEYNNRREGPILEGDEKFFFKIVENIPDNQLSNWSAGIPDIRSTSIKTMLAKQTNSNIISKSKNHKKMSYNALTNLNLIYLYYSNRFQDQKNDFYFFDYDLDNNLLGFFNSENILKLDIYNLLMQATNSQHSLSAGNRKFYWNPIESYFEPINYDSNPNINASDPTTTTVSIRLPISQEFNKAFGALENKLGNLDLEKIYKNLKLSGIDISKIDLVEKINKILLNLNAIKENYLNLDAELIEHNKFKLLNNNILTKFNDALNQIDPSVYLIKNNPDNGQFQRCKIYLKMCEDYYLSNANLLNLLEGELVLDEKEYQYLGTGLDFINIAEHKNYNKLKFAKAIIYYDDGIEIKNSSDQNLLNIYQNKPGSRIFIINGELENLKINFNGYKFSTPQKRSDLQKINHYQPVDINGLTGCLSLINLKVKNISIQANGSSCEDTINLINVDGNINNITVKDSLSDGLDIDFSKLQINNINISSAYNDCLDLSFGHYKMKNIDLANCGDKGLSVGERSSLILDKITVDKADTGIAVKDSSNATIEYLDIKNSVKCINLYRKKQEFSGAIANLKFVNCHDGKIEQQAGSFINRNTL